MKRGSVGAANQKQTIKKPKTHAEIAQQLLGNIEQEMMKQLTLGKVNVNTSLKPLPQPKKSENPNFSNPQQYLQSIQTSLKALRQSIQQSKRVQKQQQRVKKIKAKELIDRMKKEKEEHQLKIREHSQKSMLSSRIYSETTINKMRQKLEERITQKKREIEQRVKSIEQRKKVRDEKYVNQQIQYWQKVKDIKQKSKSTPKLPRIGSLDLSSKDNSTSIRKNTSFITNSEPSKPQQPQKGLQHYLKIAKSRQQHLKLKLVQQRNQSRLEKIINSNSNLASRLQNSHSSRVVEVIPFNANKHKLMGDEFLKESLLLIKKNQSITHIQPQEPQQKDTIQVQAHEATISKNAKVQKMRQKWQRTLSKIQHNQINMQQGLDLLNNIEKRLDKIDFNGIKQRLGKKYQIFQMMPQMFDNNKKIQVEGHREAQGQRKE